MIKKVHKYSFDRKAKYVLSVISLSTALVMTSCTNNEVVQTSEVVVYTSEAAKEPVNIIDGDKPLTSIATNKTNYTSVSITPEQYQSYILELNDINPAFEYEKLYNIDAALTEYNKYNYTKHHENKFSNLTADELYKIVIDNNKEYKDKTGTLNFKDLSDSDLKHVCSLIIDTVNDQLNNASDVHEDEIKCVLSNLTVFESSVVIGKASVRDEDVLLIAPEMLDENQKKSILDETIIHETIHLIQKGCQCDYKYNDIKAVYGFSKEYPNLEVNSLKYSWLYEASAEKCMADYKKIDPLIYDNYINEMESLGLVCTINSDYKVHDIEHLIYKDSLDDLYAYFDITSDQDKREILNMMYSIEVAETSPLDFYHKYEEQLGYSIQSQEKTNLVNNLKMSSHQVITKLFYHNLAKRLSEEEIPLNDIFYLMAVYENDLNCYTHYDVTRRYDDNKEMINNYIKMQDSLFTILAENLNLSTDDIINEYENYKAYALDGSQNEVNNYDLSWLGNDKITYIDERKEELTPFIGVSVRIANKEIQEELGIKTY